jgi:hypothetical protein
MILFLMTKNKKTYFVFNISAYFIGLFIITTNFVTASELPECRGEYWDNCYGLYEWDNGSTYLGEWSNNVIDGFGLMFWPDYRAGSWMQYEGNWKSGLMHGNGVYEFSTGEEYRGMFNNGERSGYGVQKWPNGDIYVGQWFNDEMHGQGKFTYIDGTIKNGTWSMGEFISSTNQIDDNSGSDFAEGEFLGGGSGFLINSSGNIVTNDHVIESCRTLKVYINDNKYEASVVATNRYEDLAVLRSNINSNIYYQLAKYDPNILDDVTVVGFPFGNELSSSVKVNKGIISAETGIDDKQSEFQMDAAIQPGNSGGPVLNEAGDVVGVVFAKVDYDFIMDQFGLPPEDMNFGVKVDVLKDFLDKEQIKYFLSNDETKDKVRLIKDATVYIECFG